MFHREIVRSHFKPVACSPLTIAKSKDSIALTKDADADVDITIQLSLPADKEVVIDWGDGDSSTVTGPQSATDYDHTYDDAAEYPIVITGDLDEITRFRMVGEPVSGDASQFALMTSLGYLSCGENSLTGDISSWSTLTSLTELYCYSNSLSYTTTTLPDWDSCNIFSNNNAWTVTEVNAFLTDLDSASSASTKILNIGGTNAAPTGAGATAVTSLETKGWDVTVTA